MELELSPINGLLGRPNEVHHYHTITLRFVVTIKIAYSSSIEI